MIFTIRQFSTVLLIAFGGVFLALSAFAGPLEDAQAQIEIMANADSRAVAALQRAQVEIDAGDLEGAASLIATAETALAEIRSAQGRLTNIRSSAVFNEESDETLSGIDAFIAQASGMTADVSNRITEVDAALTTAQDAADQQVIDDNTGVVNPDPDPSSDPAPTTDYQAQYNSINQSTIQNSQAFNAAASSADTALAGGDPYGAQGLLAQMTSSRDAIASDIVQLDAIVALFPQGQISPELQADIRGRRDVMQDELSRSGGIDERIASARSAVQSAIDAANNDGADEANSGQEAGADPAVSPNDNGGIVPCGNGTDMENACTMCHFITLGHEIISFLTRILIITCIVIITISGVLYVVSAGDSGMITTAKNAIKYALIGAIVVLSAWVLITFVIRSLAAPGDGQSAENPGIGIYVGENAWDFTCSADGF